MVHEPSSFQWHVYAQIEFTIFYRSIGSSSLGIWRFCGSKLFDHSTRKARQITCYQWHSTVQAEVFQSPCHEWKTSNLEKTQFLNLFPHLHPWFAVGSVAKNCKKSPCQKESIRHRGKTLYIPTLGHWALHLGWISKLTNAPWKSMVGKVWK